MSERAVPLYEPFGSRYKRIWLPLVKLFVRLLFLVLGPITIRDRRKVPAEGGLLILANHLADVDPPVVQVACPRPIRFMAKSELFDMFGVRRVLAWTKSFPVKRGEPDRTALKQAAELLKQGEAVCIFPEGQLSETGEMQELKPGVALVVRMAGVPVICCGLQNTNYVMPYGRVIPRLSFRRVKAHWGEPKLFDKSASAEEIMSWAEAELKRLIRE